MIFIATSLATTAYATSETGQAYTTEKNSSSNHSLTRKIVKVGGDTFRYMVQWSIWGQARQKSEYDHNKKQHRTTSMMNSNNIRSGWKNPKITATAKTPWYWSYSSNNSYWLLDNL
ncbi:hypothetical protein [Brochothrix thermosphacta]|uniref:hypothetical protein n=2 Tax=Brochothrix thermosphacta TaxID=2756 RepID=UPI00114624C3|nr:hypothetical protein [Brochothrix thermosphacta]